MWTIILTFVSKIFSSKTNIIIMMVLVIISLLLGMTWLNGKLKYEKSEKERMTNNFQSSKFLIDSVVDRNGKLQYTSNSLTLKKRELEQFNSELTNKISDLNIKLKNVQFVGVINTEYFYHTDTVPVEKKSENVFIGKLENKWINLSQRVTLVNNKTGIVIDSLNLSLKDSIYIVNEITHKGWWFWKKATGIKIHVQGQNPYSKINKIESYQLIK